MKFNSLITINSSNDDIVQKFNGSWITKANKEHLIFDDTSLIEGTKIPSRICISETKVSIIRNSKIISNMEFNLNSPTTCIYTTPYGNMNITTTTSYIDLRVTDNNLFVKLIYNLIIEGEKKETATIKITASK